MTLEELQEHLNNGTLSARQLIAMNPIEREALLAQIPKRQALSVQKALDTFIAWETK